jgi:hypothetical protein
MQSWFKFKRDQGVDVEILTYTECLKISPEEIIHNIIEKC